MRREGGANGHAARLRGYGIASVMLMSVGVIGCGHHQRGVGAQPSTADGQLADPAGGPSGRGPAGESGMNAMLDQSSRPTASRACIPTDQAEPDSLPGVQPWVPETAAAGDAVPLRAGLTVVTAIATPDGDYESLKSITSVTDGAATIDLSAVVPFYDRTTNKTTPRSLNSHRLVLRADQDTACGFAPVFGSRLTTDPPEVYTGTTGITFSARALAALKTGQDVYVRVMTPEFGEVEDHGHWVHRVEAHPVGIPVILNDQPATLPAVHAQCDTTISYTIGRNGARVRHVGCEYFILDDAQDPLVLIWRTMGLKEDTTLRSVSNSALRGTDKTGFLTVKGVLQLDTTQLQVVHLDEADVDLASGDGGEAEGAGAGGADASAKGGGAGSAGEQRMEQALSKERKVMVYGIYFDFAQATIKQASGPALREIATLMQRNPSWSLAINDYTDNIGGDVDNLALSRRRATAVRDTLITGFGIAATRLTSAGFGSASPVDANSTLEGRARNRRVELIRR
jgi:outer membrane protein OmpA-like peptidoglycan-associated protein